MRSSVQPGCNEVDAVPTCQCTCLAEYYGFQSCINVRRYTTLTWRACGFFLERRQAIPGKGSAKSLSSSLTEWFW